MRCGSLAAIFNSSVVAVLTTVFVTTLGTPFRTITVIATLSTHDTNLTRAAHSLGATGLSVLDRERLPSILPSVITGIRDQINPTIMAAATMVLCLSVGLFAALAFGADGRAKVWMPGREGSRSRPAARKTL